MLFHAAAEEAGHGETLAVVADERRRAVGQTQDTRQIGGAKAAELAVHGVAREAAAAHIRYRFQKAQPAADWGGTESHPD